MAGTPYAPPTPYGPLSGNTGGLQFVDEVLSNIARLFRPYGFLYDQIVSPQNVQYNIGRYPVFDPAGFFSAGGNLNVADDAPTPLIDINYSHDTYQCLDYRLQTRITRKEAVQANPVLRLDYAKTTALLTQFAANRETRLANALLHTSHGGQLTQLAATPSVKWDQGTSGSPASIQSDLQGAALQVYKTIGRRPNTLVLTQSMAYALANDFTLKDLIKYTIGTRIVEEGQPAVLPPSLFGFKVLIAEGVLQNLARPGDPAMNLVDTWGTSARLIYTDPNAQWGIPATVYSFRGRVTDGPTQAPDVIMPTDTGGQEPGAAANWAVVDRWWDFDPPGEHIRAWECVTEKVVAPDMGIEIPNVLANP